VTGHPAYEECPWSADWDWDWDDGRQWFFIDTVNTICELYLAWISLTSTQYMP